MELLEDANMQYFCVRCILCKEYAVFCVKTVKVELLEVGCKYAVVKRKKEQYLARPSSTLI